jgi:hypothetical protein
MKSMKRIKTRWKSWIPALLVLIPLLFLLTPLMDSEFHRGIPLPPKESVPDATEISFSEGSTDLVSTLFRGFFIIALIITGLGLLLSRETRRLVLASSMTALVLFGGIILIYYLKTGSAPPRGHMDDSEAYETGEDGLLGPEVEEFAQLPGTPEVSNLLSFGIGILLLSLLGIGGYLLYHRLIRNRRPRPLEDVRKAAEKALKQTGAGEGLRNTVIRCYAEMISVLHEKRGIDRRASMTPREFETRLLSAGFPGEAVDQLTWLFERVRYGSKELTEEEESEALHSLESIVDICGEH